MLIAISCTKDEIHARFDRRFGRCEWFLLWNTTSLSGRFVRNKLMGETQEAGPGAAEVLYEHKVQQVFSGDFGEPAAEKLRELGIQMFILRDDGLSLFEILKLRGKTISITS